MNCDCTCVYQQQPAVSSQQPAGNNHCLLKIIKNMPHLYQMRWQNDQFYAVLILTNLKCMEFVNGRRWGADMIFVCLYRKFAEITQFCIHLPCVEGGKRFRGPHNSYFHEGCSDSVSSVPFLLYQIKLTLGWKTTKTEEKNEVKNSTSQSFLRNIILRPPGRL